MERKSASFKASAIDFGGVDSVMPRSSSILSLLSWTYFSSRQGSSCADALYHEYLHFFQPVFPGGTVDEEGEIAGSRVFNDVQIQGLKLGRVFGSLIHHCEFEDKTEWASRTHARPEGGNLRT